MKSEFILAIKSLSKASNGLLNAMVYQMHLWNASNDLSNVSNAAIEFWNERPAISTTSELPSSLIEDWSWG